MCACVSLSQQKNFFWWGKSCAPLFHPLQMGLHYCQKPAEGQGEDNLIMNEAIRLSPDLTHSHNGKCAVTIKFLPGKASETQRLTSHKLCPFVLKARLSWNLLIWKVKEGIVETLVKSSQQWLCTCMGEDGGGGERSPHQVPLSAAPDPLGDLGRASKPAQEQPLLLPYSTLCGIRDIPARMRSKGDSSAQGYHCLGVCPTQLFHEALLAQTKTPTPLSTWKILEE